MSGVTCYACRKKYNYEEDAFCPRCGAFNLRSKGSYTVSANGDIIRVDGINESSHAGSFLHAEYHTEEKERRKLGLDQERPPEKSEEPVPRPQVKPVGKKQNPVGVVFVIVWIMVVLSMMFSAFAELLLW